ncbi:lactate racemase domain-containing protein [uncultured Desulfosarcina sp.]|uniref:lactate racemase domain-containing protein n=1 Tax=uncultured Desulfosarcina sp. TaxID=218289 RepID=UPI0029C6A8EF|nr:lactate racemase domain-containing protein [uncultured Desulfosarcina sp.]
MIRAKLHKIKQELDQTRIDNIRQHIHDEFQKQNCSTVIGKGKRVAIAVGSRGINQIDEIVKSVVDEVQKAGAAPFIVPSMGSHGGATAEGQKEILENYGILEQNVNAPIVSSMETAHLGETKSGIPVCIDKNASEADHIIVINRIKPHTEFKGSIESGLMKMMVIGLGKHKGALNAHNYAVKFGYEKTLTEIGKHIIDNANITFGVGIVENGYGATHTLRVIKGSDIYQEEKQILNIAQKTCPKLPFKSFDILVVDECGKEISGTGMDTKVIGRIMNIYEEELQEPKITRIILRSLTEKTHGNAVGVGLADFVTKNVYENINFEMTYINCLTAVAPEKARLPIVCPNDAEALKAAIGTCGPVDEENIKIVWIKNTSKLGEMYISDGLVDTAKENTHIQFVGEPETITFDDDGNLSRHFFQ